MSDVKSKHYSVTVFTIIFVLFAITICTFIGLRSSVMEYASRAEIIYEDRQLKLFDTILNDAIELGRFGLVNSSNKLQQDIKQNLDLDELKYDLEYNRPNAEFDNILRDSLQTNIFTKNGMSSNRNSIFVIVNGNIIAHYSHDSVYLSEYLTRLGDTDPLDIYSIVDSQFYNKELSTKAIDRLINQEAGYIVWQSRAPKNGMDIPKYSNITINEIHDIFLKYGYEGLESYEFLITSYITSYGNMFGDYDSTTGTVNNKIILVQKLNIVDYIKEFHPDVFDNFKDQTLYRNYSQMMTNINIFIILECMAIIGYAIMFINYYNHKIIVEEIISEIEDDNEDDDKEKG